MIIGTIISALIGLVFFSGAIKYIDKKHGPPAPLFFYLSVMSFILAGMLLHEYAYKSGQIDAINNNIKYELVEQPNGESVWKQIENK